MDHPAFVVVEVLDSRRVVAEFRGGVKDSYFEGTPVTLWPARGRPHHGNVVSLSPATEEHANKRATIEFPAKVKAALGDVLTWTTGPQRIEGDLFYTPACDDLSGVAAAFSSFDALLADDTKRDIRLLLTRAEEVGFIGAIAACKAGTIPRCARLIALENSKSFAESPIGAGPIVRVGDATSTFDPDLTYRCGKIAQQIAAQDPSFKYQRKLMPGGTCEASAYLSYGYTATCLCLPLGNYHNMNEATGKIDSEYISLADYDGLVRLLVEIGRRLDEPKLAPPLKGRLDDLFASRRGVLSG
jgi:endoglucanase